MDLKNTTHLELAQSLLRIASIVRIWVFQLSTQDSELALRIAEFGYP